MKPIFGYAFWTATWSTQLSREMETSDVAEALLMYKDDHQGNWPEHAVLLLSDDLLTSFEFVSGTSLTYEWNVPVGNTTLDQYDTLTSKQQVAVDRDVHGVAQHSQVVCEEVVASASPLHLRPKRPVDSEMCICEEDSPDHDTRL